MDSNCEFTFLLASTVWSLLNFHNRQCSTHTQQSLNTILTQPQRLCHISDLTYASCCLPSSSLWNFIYLDLTCPSENSKMSNLLSPLAQCISHPDIACLHNDMGEMHNSVPIDVVDVGPELTQCLSLTPGMHALLPSESLPVSDLLELCFPTLSGVMPSMDPGMCFSSHTLTESIAFYLSRPVPPPTFVEGLHGVASQAMLNGKLSIVDWTCKNPTTFFSFELIKFWTVLTKVIDAKWVWVATMKWLEQAGEDQSLEQDVHKVCLMIQTMPWSAGIQILHSHLTFLEMATFLSDGWLSSSQVDMALSSIALRQRGGADSQVLSHYLIGTTILSEYLHSSPIFIRRACHTMTLSCAKTTNCMHHKIYSVPAIILYSISLMGRFYLLRTPTLVTGQQLLSPLVECWNGLTL